MPVGDLVDLRVEAGGVGVVRSGSEGALGQSAPGCPNVRRRFAKGSPKAVAGRRVGDAGASTAPSIRPRPPHIAVPVIHIDHHTNEAFPQGREIGRSQGGSIGRCSPTIREPMKAIQQRPPSQHTQRLVSIACRLTRKDGPDDTVFEAPARTIAVLNGGVVRAMNRVFQRNETVLTFPEKPGDQVGNELIGHGSLFARSMQISFRLGKASQQYHHVVGGPDISEIAAD